MKLTVTPDLTLEHIREILQKALPHYKIELLRSPVFNFNYVLITQNFFMGAWIRRFEEKKCIEIKSCILNDFLRGLLFFLEIFLVLSQFRNRIVLEVKNTLDKNI